MSARGRPFARPRASRTWRIVTRTCACMRCPRGWLRSERITFAWALVGACRSRFACAIAGNHVGPGALSIGCRRVPAIGFGGLASQVSLPIAEEGTAVVTVNRMDDADDSIDEPARNAIQAGFALGAHGMGSLGVRRIRRENAGRGRARAGFGRSADHDPRVRGRDLRGFGRTNPGRPGNTRTMRP
jgi:hypothetical protein